MFILQIKSIDPFMDQLANVPVESYKWGFRVLVALAIGLHKISPTGTTARIVSAAIKESGSITRGLLFWGSLTL